jgi:CRP/FNR family transcriptional regulator, cyclic AMP receptor protein
MPWIELLGYAASITVLATFCMRTMLPLRILAIASSVLFIMYGLFDHLYPVLILCAILFPINLYGLFQILRLRRSARTAQAGTLSIEGLLPYMRQRRFSAGETLFREGDSADSLYYIGQGEVEVVEL